MLTILSVAQRLLLLAVAVAPPAPAREVVQFRLYKFQLPIGVERSTVVHGADGATEVRTTFAFSDRGTEVPLAATLRLAADGAVERFAVWGSLSRFSQVDERVEVDGDTVSIEQAGELRREPLARVSFAGSAYAPVVLTELLWRYWSTHGRPQHVRLYPAGEASIEPRGSEEVPGDDGKPHRLDRYALAGRGWGRETFWIDGEGHLAAFKSVDAEFDHFEATRQGYGEALPAIVASAGRDGIEALRQEALREEAQRQASPGETRGPTAFVGATLIDGTGAAPVPDAVVLIDHDRIAAAGPRARVKIPRAARRVDVAGKTILPGLWDMHAHFEQVEWGPVYLAAGVTTVRDCGNELPFVTAVRDAIDAGQGIGPRILLACLVDGEGRQSLGTTRLREEREIPELIRRFREARCSQVKIYSSLDPRLIAPLARAAHAAGMTVTGHIPSGIGALHAVEAGMDQINHADYVVRALLPVPDPDAQLSRAEYERALESVDPEAEPSRAILSELARRGVVVDPTLALTELGMKDREALMAAEPGLSKVAPPLRKGLDFGGPPPGSEARVARFWQAYLGTVRALHAAGVPIVAGTDQAVPGHSLHREMELYVAAGFTPLAAIQAATIVPARAMHRDRDLGTVEPGKLADLIVVDGDPLADIRNLRRIVTVVQGGRAYDPAPLWRMVGFQP